MNSCLIITTLKNYQYKAAISIPLPRTHHMFFSVVLSYLLRGFLLAIILHGWRPQPTSVAYFLFACMSRFTCHAGCTLCSVFTHSSNCQTRSETLLCTEYQLLYSVITETYDSRRPAEVHLLLYFKQTGLLTLEIELTVKVYYEMQWHQTTKIKLL